MTSLRQYIRRRNVYPITAMYVGVVGVVMQVASGAWSVELGLSLMAILAVGVVLFLGRRDVRAAQAEVHVIHELVNSQHDDLVARVEQLTRALERAGVRVPSDPAREGDR